MLELARHHALGMDVGYLLELQGNFPRLGVGYSPAEHEYVVFPVEVFGKRFYVLLIQLHGFLNLAGK